MWIRSTITVCASLSLSLLPAAGSRPAADEAARTPITIESASPEWVRRIEWGVDRFRAAGLQLPPTTVTVHEDKASCNGNSGLYRSRYSEVHLCISGSTDSRVARLNTLHELAHAWAETQLTDDEQAAFLHLRELQYWADSDTPRHEWGAEHAAEVVSWGLMDELIPIIRIYNAEPSELAVAFDLLVGRSPLSSPPDSSST